MVTPHPPSVLTTMPTVYPPTLLTSMPALQIPPDLPAYLQEKDLSQECRDLIVSLPAEKGWVANYLHQYQGFWHTTRQLKGVIACQNHFQAQESDIFLVTTPKSGTTWLKAIMFALVNRKHFSDTKQQHPLLTNNPHVLVPFLEHQYIDTQLPDFTSFTSPRLFSTHLPFASLPKSVEDWGCKLVYLCRNPKDTFVSLWHFTNKLRPKEKGENSLEETFDKFCRGVSLYGPFWDHVLGYWKQSLEKPERVLFLKYEDFKEEPKGHLMKLSEFLNCPFSQEEESSGAMDEILNLCSFDYLSNLEVNKTGKLPSGEENSAFFRRGQVGDSKSHLSAEMSEKMDHITKEKLQVSGLNL
ncbi:cytosolic sulfotransferase 12 [Ricinus communis]|uniref:Sulfotransferase n=1 Tax=Ricinus communis TaxID=3988 RepID=B9RE91_RICCO|nr:cytosolic sulfotransferase 12 [Ricinus communis]EEF50699.1 Flavonol 4'-sulfotransferase, putative [Ricinus communis]|eukprot:XP_002512030.1 cytosolic sulfotransferase 12 [Ricinus communis]